MILADLDQQLQPGRTSRRRCWCIPDAGPGARAGGPGAADPVSHRWPGRPWRQTLRRESLAEEHADSVRGHDPAQGEADSGGRRVPRPGPAEKAAAPRPPVPAPPGGGGGVPAPWGTGCCCRCCAGRRPRRCGQLAEMEVPRPSTPGTTAPWQVFCPRAGEDYAGSARPRRRRRPGGGSGRSGPLTRRCWTSPIPVQARRPAARQADRHPAQGPGGGPGDRRARGPAAPYIRPLTPAPVPAGAPGTDRRRNGAPPPIWCCSIWTFPEPGRGGPGRSSCAGARLLTEEQAAGRGLRAAGAVSGIAAGGARSAEAGRCCGSTASPFWWTPGGMTRRRRPEDTMLLQGVVDCCFRDGAGLDGGGLQDRPGAHGGGSCRSGRSTTGPSWRRTAEALDAGAGKAGGPPGALLPRHAGRAVEL